ncbi:unnamed protein product [Camellia sinensis]
MRLFISLEVSYFWPLQQLNVKNVFLHGDLLETIYMAPPLDFQAEGEYSRKVCRLLKSLYGPKQSPQAWFGCFNYVISMGFVQCHSAHTCFIHRNSMDQCIILLIYVDDIILTSDDSVSIGQVKKNLGQTFDIKDIGCLKYFSRIEVAHSRQANFFISKEVHS